MDITILYCCYGICEMGPLGQIFQHQKFLDQKFLDQRALDQKYVEMFFLVYCSRVDN